VLPGFSFYTTMIHWKQQQLELNKTFITSEKGNSMTPLIKSGQEHELTPITWEKVTKGDIVFCKVKGNYFTHLVVAVDKEKGCLISNNHGRINGWTRKVYGRVTKIF
jgi:hypothetical protein